MVDQLTGTQADKKIKLDAACADVLKQIEDAECEMKYWKGIGRIIENKISLAQSVLSNITSMVKADMYVNNIK